MANRASIQIVMLIELQALDALMSEIEDEEMKPKNLSNIRDEGAFICEGSFGRRIGVNWH